MKEPIFYATSKQTHELICWSNSSKLISNYLRTILQGEYNVECISKKKFFKKYTADIYEPKELIKFNNNIFTMEIKEYLESKIDEDFYRVAETIEFLKVLPEKVKLTEKEDKRINKAIDVLIDVFNDFEENYRLDDVTLTLQTIVELREQEEHLKNIIM